MEDSKVLPQSRKRPCEQTATSIQDSPHYKVRAVLKDLRPHFIEVRVIFESSRSRILPSLSRAQFFSLRLSRLKTRQIRARQLARLDLLEVLKTPDFQSCKAACDIREGMKLLIDLYKDMITESTKLETRNRPPDYSSRSISNGPRPLEHRQDVKPTANSPQNGGPGELSGHLAQGTYIIGGSAFGWNFITFNSNKAVYYGRTREDFRGANAKSVKGENIGL
ncbi:hypothetical protein OROGR_021082 [Orobanche gracilis]